MIGGGAKTLRILSVYARDSGVRAKERFRLKGLNQGRSNSSGGIGFFWTSLKGKHVRGRSLKGKSGVGGGQAQDKNDLSSAKKGGRS